jgi:Family of unknown function (DUF6006)
MITNIFRKILIGFFALACVLPAQGAFASLAAGQWYIGDWDDCRIDGRPARMRWRIVNAPQNSCNGNLCNSTSGYKLVGSFSDMGSAWVPLSIRYNQNNQLGIRYLGDEQNNWVLRYNPKTKIAKGHTTWRGKQYPLSCSR